MSDTLNAFKGIRQSEEITQMFKSSKCGDESKMFLIVVKCMLLCMFETQAPHKSQFLVILGFYEIKKLKYQFTDIGFLLLE